MTNTNTPFEQLFDQMRRAMTGNVGFEASMSPGFGFGGGMDTNTRVEETDGGYVVYADMPGFETGEIDLRFEDGMLTIAAEQETEDGHGSEDAEHAMPEGTTGYRRRRVHERLSIPADVQIEDIEATYRNGVLKVFFPVETADDDAHRIDIE